jgi:glycine cleavage system H protein
VPIDPQNTLYYKRVRFATRLPRHYRYTASHCWLLEVTPGLWRCGFTKFALRMLGDLVELEFEMPGRAGGVSPTSLPVHVGQAIGWVEGFKARSDIYCVAAGQFAGGNLALDADLTLVDNDPYDQGWLYEVRGQPDPAALDVDGYVAVLDATIDRMLATQHDPGAEACPNPRMS